MVRCAALALCCFVLSGCVSSSTGQRPMSDREAAEANVNLGAGYLRQGRLDLAIERLERAIELEPRLADAHSTLAIAFDQLGRPADAERHYARATQLEPDNAPAANSYAVFLCRNNRWRDAEPYFLRAANNVRYPTPAAALTNAGVCARGVQDFDKAEQYLRAALERTPNFPDALTNLSELAYQRGNYLQARAFSQRYFDMHPATAPMLLLCVRIERQLEDRAAEQRCARQLREDFPNSSEVAQVNASAD